MNQEPVTVTVTKETYEMAKLILPKLWDVVTFNGRLGIVYAVSKVTDEDGPAITLKIMGWKVYKSAWRNNLKLWWLKTRVKLNMI